jgi:hypothetical protein
VVDMTNRADVYVRLAAVELLCHLSLVLLFGFLDSWDFFLS